MASLEKTPPIAPSIANIAIKRGSGNEDAANLDGAYEYVFSGQFINVNDFEITATFTLESVDKQIDGTKILDMPKEKNLGTIDGNGVQDFSIPFQSDEELHLGQNLNYKIGAKANSYGFTYAERWEPLGL